MLVASAVFLAAALSLCWPMLTGQFLAGDDQVLAGYSFRLFGAEYFKAHGTIPEWNPYLFGGMPFIAAMHGDIFYPTAWLRWLVQTDVGMTVGFFAHLVIAGLAMYALLRGLGASWTAAVAAGVGYELSGIVASMLRPGHDGKLFVAALAPFAFLALLRAIRQGRLGRYGVFALIIGLCMLSPHYQMTYYLLVACGLFAVWLTFFDRERSRARTPVADLGLASVAVALGIGIGMIQGLPFLKYIPYSPRVEGGDSSGWEYATSYAMPIEELMSTVLPQFNGLFEFYWGQNFFKTHNEYLGAIVVVLAILGLGVAKRRGLLLGFGMIAGLFLLVAFGAHTPFYRLWYTVMPMMDKVRAAGMAFFLVALCVCVWAGLGIDRVLSGQVSARRLYIPLGAIGLIAVLGAVGARQGLAEALAGPQEHVRAALGANAPEMRAGALRLLLVTVIGGGVLLAIQRGMLRGAGAATALIAVVFADNWSVLRKFPEWLPPGAVAFADDDLTLTMRQAALPFRAFDPSGGAAGAQVYAGSWLMARQVPTLFGYHGNESRFFDELFGTKNIWTNQFSASLLDLYAVRYIVANQPIDAVVQGYTPRLGPVTFPNLTSRRAQAGFLFERDSAPKWVRVVPAAVKVPEAQIIPTLIDPRFPANSVALYSDTATVDAAPLASIPPPSDVTPTVAAWAPGALTVSLTGVDTRTTYLLVAENWYPGWSAVVDGVVVPTLRANYAMLSVPLPPGAKQVVLTYTTPGYATGKVMSLAALIGAVGLVGAGRVRRRIADV